MGRKEGVKYHGVSLGDCRFIRTAEIGGYSPKQVAWKQFDKKALCLYFRASPTDCFTCGLSTIAICNAMSSGFARPWAGFLFPGP